MKMGALAAMIISGISVLIISVGADLLGFMCLTWGLALSGYLSGQADAVTAAMTSFLVIGIAVDLLTLLLAIASVYFFTEKRQWESAAAGAASICSIGTVSVALHALGLLAGFVVASVLKTGN